MEKRTIAQRLALAESQVQHGDTQLIRQRALVNHLERHRLGTFHARKLLRELEETQICFIADRDQLKAEMALLIDSPAVSSQRAPAPSVAPDLRADTPLV